MIIVIQLFPEGIRAYVQYGDSVSVLAGLLSTYGAVSTMRIHVLLGSLLGVSLSTGTITPLVSKCAQKVGDTLQTIKSMLIGAKVAHFDETGTDVNGKTIWVHNSSTPELTYQTIVLANKWTLVGLYDKHKRLYDVIASGNGPAAEAEMFLHIDGFRVGVMETLGDQEE